MADGGSDTGNALLSPRNWAQFPIAPSSWPFYYGWMIVACSSVGIIASVPGQTIGVGVFVDFLSDAMRLSRDDLSTNYLIGTLISSVTMPFAGRLVDRWGARVMGVVSSVGLGLCLLGFSLSTMLSPPGDVAWWRAMITICLLFFGIRFFGQGCLTLVSRVMLGRWFHYRRGLATSISGIFVSIAFTGTGAWVLNALVLGLGWRTAYFSLFLGIGVGVALFAWIFFRDNPEQCGLPKDGFNVSAPKARAGMQATPYDLTVSQAMATVSFWAFNLGLAIHALLMTAIAFHLTALGAEMGLTRAATYAVLLPMPVFSISGSFFCGWMCDRFDQKWALLLMMLCLALGISGFLSVASLSGKLLVMAGLGFSGGCFGIISTVVWPHYFGQKHLGAINGVSMFIVVFASALGPKLFSYLEVYAGGFELVLLISRATPLLVIVLGMFAALPRQPEKMP